MLFVIKIVLFKKERKYDYNTEANSLRDRINKVLSKKALNSENEEVQLEKVIDLLPNYDPVSYDEDEDDDSDKDEEVSD